MKKFSFKYSTIVWLILSFVIILLLTAFAWNTYNIIVFAKIEPSKIIKFSASLTVTAILLLITVSFALCGKYVIKDGLLFCNIGIFKFKANINDITQITHFKSSDKLVVYFKNEKYTVIVISSKYYADFVSQILKENPSVYYDTEIENKNNNL